jgi:hypothetical protein
VATGQFPSEGKKLMRLLENSRVADVGEILGQVIAIVNLIDGDKLDRFLKTLSDEMACGNGEIWCVNASALVQFGTRNGKIAASFVEKLSELFTSHFFGPQNLALAFQSLSILIDQITDQLQPLFLFRPALLSAGHPNAILRRASLALLGVILELGLAAGAPPEVTVFQTSRYVSTALDDAVNLFEGGIVIQITGNFCHAVSVALTQGLQETETRREALNFCRNHESG